MERVIKANQWSKASIQSNVRHMWKNLNEEKLGLELNKFLRVQYTQRKYRKSHSPINAGFILVIICAVIMIFSFKNRYKITVANSMLICKTLIKSTATMLNAKKVAKVNFKIVILPTVALLIAKKTIFKKKGKNLFTNKTTKPKSRFLNF